MQIQTVGIIGYGHFGKFIHQVIRDHMPHIQVKISSRSYAHALPREEVCACDLVFPCVPIDRFSDILSEIAPLLGPASVLIDVCTVKSHPVSCLKAVAEDIGFSYIATHPMFGPQSYKKQGSSLQDLRIVLCDHNVGDELLDQTRVFLRSLGLKVLEMSADEHDRQLASTLFLTHYISQVVYAGGFDRTEIDTVTFGYLMDAVESVSDDKELFLDVWKYNPYCREVLEKFHAVQERVEGELG